MRASLFVAVRVVWFATVLRTPPESERDNTTDYGTVLPSGFVFCGCWRQFVRLFPKIYNRGHFA
jgi:hypothetical protein